VVEETVAAGWGTIALEAFVGLREWRVQHPTATWNEIEAALDSRLSRLRARLLQDLALASAAAQVEALPAAARPSCPGCGGALTARGQQARPVTVGHEQTVTLTRSYTVCATCGAGLFPPG
jgi:hypothetical protein